MPRADRDRFDDVPRSHGRVGAHRAENPGMNGWYVLLWAAVATIVLGGLGIFGAMIQMGKITFGEDPVPTVAQPSATPTGVVDTTYAVLVLNATATNGLAAGIRDQIVNAGWPADTVVASDADAQNFPQTTVYYATPDDKLAAMGLANVIGGAKTVQSDAYGNDAVAGQKQLTVVLGLDRAGTAVPPASEEPSPPADSSTDGSTAQ